MSKDLHGGIIRVEKNRNYSVTNNTGAHDKRLSHKAKGILWYALTRPDDWELRPDDLVNQSADGIAAVKSGIRELKKYGYYKKERVRINGKLDWVTTIYEVPQDADFSHKKVNPPSVKNRPMEEPESPSVDFLSVEKPSIENRPIYKGLREQRLNNQVQKEGRVEDCSLLPSTEEDSTEESETYPPCAVRIALCEVCGISEQYLARRKDVEAQMQNAQAFLLAEFHGDEQVAASALRERYAPGVWQKRTPPHLFQVAETWPKQGRILELQQQPTNEVNNGTNQNNRAGYSSPNAGRQSAAQRKYAGLADRIENIIRADGSESPPSDGR